MIIEILLGADEAYLICVIEEKLPKHLIGNQLDFLSRHSLERLFPIVVRLLQRAQGV
ncbi:MAG: hypothetical protein MJZ84_05175 [Paludibacteraceae bacterium]|nr:hypothetical protein [Paludibacteraceae bacterium]